MRQIQSKLVFVIPLILTISCSPDATQSHLSSDRDIHLTEEARALHSDAIVIDGHNDLPLMLDIRGDGSLNHIDLNQENGTYRTDLARLKKGGVGAQFWSVHRLDIRLMRPLAFERHLQIFDIIDRMHEQYPEVLLDARSHDDVLEANHQGKIASLVGVESGHAIENSLENLRTLYDRGARYMTLTHFKSLAWADSANDTPRVGGLSDFGIEVVEEMNRLGMMVDIAHASEETMLQAIAVSDAPVIASHIGARGVTDKERNISDEALRAMAAKGGVAMVVMASRWITTAEDGGGLLPYASIHDFLDHIDHMVDVAGIDHVGIGSDFDGDFTFPEQLDDVSKFPLITQGLLDRGYSHEDIRKILGQNTLRVFKEVEDVAARQ